MKAPRLNLVLALAVSLSLLAAATRTEAGLGDKPAVGKVVWMFTSAHTSNTLAVAVQCTNYDKAKDAAVTFEFFQWDGTLEGSTSLALGPGETRAVATANTVFTESVIVGLGAELTTGSVRVVSDGSKNLICSAYLVEEGSTGVAPGFMSPLPRFSKAGK